MEDEVLQEQMLSAWIGLNALLKDTRVTKSMSYNEAIVMHVVLENYQKDGIGLTPVSQIISQTRMLKSLVNRTINKLYVQGYLEKRKDSEDGRMLSVLPVKEKLPEFLEVHRHSLDLARKAIDVIGKEDAARFIDIAQKLMNARLDL